MKSEELVDVVCVLQEWFCVHVHILEEIDDDLLEFLVHLTADPLLNDTYNFVVVLDTQDQISHSLYLTLVGLFFKLLNHGQNALSML